MSPPSTHEVTALLRAWGAGEHTGHTLQTTALINEVYLRLLDTAGVSWQDRAHFFALCAQMMRRILTDLARARYSLKRGAGVRTLDLEESLVVGGRPRPGVLA